MSEVEISYMEWNDKRPKGLRVPFPSLQDAFEAGWEACLLGTPSAYWVYGNIQQERERQDGIWGGPEHDDTHTGQEWLEFIQLQIQQITDPPSYREWLVKIAALCVAAAESYDRANQ